MQRFAKKRFWEAKNRKTKTLEIRHSRVQNSGNAAFCGKKASGELKIKKEELRNKEIQECRTPEMQRFAKKKFRGSKNSKKKKLEKRNYRGQQVGNRSIWK